MKRKFAWKWVTCLPPFQTYNLSSVSTRSSVTMATIQTESIQKHFLPPREHFADTKHTAKDSSVGSRCWDGGRKLYFKLRQINFCEPHSPFSVLANTFDCPPFPSHISLVIIVQQLLYQETKDFADSYLGDGNLQRSIQKYMKMRRAAVSAFSLRRLVSSEYW